MHSDQLRMRLLMFVCSAAFFTGCLTSCWEGISRHVLATVLAVHGDVTVRPNERSGSQPITTDSVFGDGATIRTATGAEVDLMPVPGVYVRLLEHSELKIDKITLVKDGDETASGTISRTVRLRLVAGGGVACFEETDEPQSQLIVATDRVTLIANPGTLFRVATDEHATRALSARGTIYTAAAGMSGAARIQAGFLQAWPSSSREPTRAADDQQEQIELSHAIKAGEELQKEQEENLPRANRFPR
jgi:hypothetical protein